MQPSDEVERVPLDYRSPSTSYEVGPRWHAWLALPGLFATGVIAVMFFAQTVGTSTEIIHNSTGLWIDWGLVVRTMWFLSVVSTSGTLLLTLAVVPKPLSRRASRAVRWNVVGLILHMLLFGTCLGVLFLSRGFHPGPA